MKVLVADSSTKSLDSLRGAIEVIGHQALEVTNINELFSILPAHFTDINLIILAWDLPDQKAEDTLNRIKADSRFEQLPILVLLPEDNKPESIRVMQSGATDCLSRALTQQDLVTRMFDCIGRAA